MKLLKIHLVCLLVPAQAFRRLWSLRGWAVLCLGLVVAMLAANAAGAVTYGAPVKLGDTGGLNHDVQINAKGQVVWIGTDLATYQVYLYDGRRTKTISSSNYKSGPAEINANGWIVWTELKPLTENSAWLDPAVFLYTNGVTQQITGWGYGDGPAINDSGWIAFEGGNPIYPYGGGIFLYSGGTSKMLTTDNGIGPAINNNGQIVYADGDGVIRLIGGNAISLSGTNNGQPQINGLGQAIWAGAPWESNKYQIYFYDGKVVKNISNSNSSGIVLSGWGKGQINAIGQVVWRDYIQGDIYLYSGGVTKNITNQTVLWNGDPQINDNGQIVWYGADPITKGSQLYLYSGGVIQKLVDPAGGVNVYNDYVCPVINNLGQIAYIGGQYPDVYLISPVGLHVNKNMAPILNLLLGE